MFPRAAYRRRRSSARRGFAHHQVADRDQHALQRPRSGGGGPPAPRSPCVQLHTHPTTRTSVRVRARTRAHAHVLTRTQHSDRPPRHALPRTTGPPAAPQACPWRFCRGLTRPALHCTALTAYRPRCWHLWSRTRARSAAWHQQQTPRSWRAFAPSRSSRMPATSFTSSDFLCVLL